MYEAEIEEFNRLAEELNQNLKAEWREDFGKLYIVAGVGWNASAHETKIESFLSMIESKRNMIRRRQVMRAIEDGCARGVDVLGYTVEALRWALEELADRVEISSMPDEFQQRYRKSLNLIENVGV